MSATWAVVFHLKPRLKTVIMELVPTRESHTFIMLCMANRALLSQWANAWKIAHFRSVLLSRLLYLYLLHVHIGIILLVEGNMLEYGISSIIWVSAINESSIRVCDYALLEKYWTLRAMLFPLFKLRTSIKIIKSAKSINIAHSTAHHLPHTSHHIIDPIISSLTKRHPHLLEHIKRRSVPIEFSVIISPILWSLSILITILVLWLIDKLDCLTSTSYAFWMCRMWYYLCFIAAITK